MSQQSAEEPAEQQCKQRVVDNRVQISRRLYPAVTRQFLDDARNFASVKHLPAPHRLFLVAQYLFNSDLPEEIQRRVLEFVVPPHHQCLCDCWPHTKAARKNTRVWLTDRVNSWRRALQRWAAEGLISHTVLPRLPVCPPPARAPDFKNRFPRWRTTFLPAGTVQCEYPTQCGSFATFAVACRFNSGPPGFRQMEFKVAPLCAVHAESADNDGLCQPRAIE